VLSLLALRQLAKRSECDEGSLRLFLRLVTDFDLSMFRMLPLKELSERYGITTVALLDGLEVLQRLGLLERGPIAKRMGSNIREASFRIRPAMILGPRELKEHFERLKQERERGTIAPPCSPHNANG
jgi:hypothetical protein